MHDPLILGSWQFNLLPKQHSALLEMTETVAAESYYLYIDQGQSLDGAIKSPALSPTEAGLVLGGMQSFTNFFLP